MFKGFRYHIWKITGKTPEYYIETYIGLFVGVCIGVYCLNTHSCFSFIADERFYDKIITICTTLFGFLLTVLTLIIQSESKVVLEMREHAIAYQRLIKFNRNVVLLSAIVCILSLFLIFIRHKVNIFLSNFLIVSNFALFTWMVIDTLIFVTIFYHILIADTKNTNES